MPRRRTTGWLLLPLAFALCGGCRLCELFKAPSPAPTRPEPNLADPKAMERYYESVDNEIAHPSATQPIQPHAVQ